MDRKKFITIHGYHNEDSKKAMREVAAIYEKVTESGRQIILSQYVAS